MEKQIIKIQPGVTPYFSGDGYTVYHPAGFPSVWVFHNEGDRVEIESAGCETLELIGDSPYDIDWG